MLFLNVNSHINNASIHEQLLHNYESESESVKQVKYKSGH